MRWPRAVMAVSFTGGEPLLYLNWQPFAGDAGAFCPPHHPTATQTH
jgi:hypothetical protein